jgi:hypothetical protein
MRIKVTRFLSQGMCGGYDAWRVEDIEDGQPLPEGVEEVSSDTPLSPWQPVQGTGGDQAASVSVGRKSGRKEG